MLLVWGLLASAQAQSAEERAAELFQNGVTLYDEGSYDAAILAFREALDLSDKAELHFNIANCLERLGRLEEAYNELNLYRAVAPAEERETLDRRLTSIRTRIEAQKTQALPVPAPAPLPPPIVRTGPSADPGVMSWTLLGAGGGVGVASLVGVGVTWIASRHDLKVEDPDAYARARAWNAASWLGVVGGAGIAIGGVLTAHVEVGTVAPGAPGVTVGGGL